jgi:hypothetical protein
VATASTPSTRVPEIIGMKAALFAPAPSTSALFVIGELSASYTVTGAASRAALATPDATSTRSNVRPRPSAGPAGVSASTTVASVSSSFTSAIPANWKSSRSTSGRSTSAMPCSSCAFSSADETAATELSSRSRIVTCSSASRTRVGASTADTPRRRPRRKRTAGTNAIAMPTSGSQTWPPIGSRSTRICAAQSSAQSPTAGKIDASAKSVASARRRSRHSVGASEANTPRYAVARTSRGKALNRIACVSRVTWPPG